MSDQRFPLSWPVGRPRSTRTEVSNFKTKSKGENGITQNKNRTIADSTKLLFNELKLMKAKGVILSSNIPVGKQSGTPLAIRSEPKDTGVAVYFDHKGSQKCFSCDRWSRVADNIYAIALTIQAIRGLERWGSGHMVDAAFRGFDALPAPVNGKKPWRDVIGSFSDLSFTSLEARYKVLAKMKHPDTGGSVKEFQELQEAYKDAKRELGYE